MYALKLQKYGRGTLCEIRNRINTFTIITPIIISHLFNHHSVFTIAINVSLRVVKNFSICELIKIWAPIFMFKKAAFTPREMKSSINAVTDE